MRLDDSGSDDESSVGEPQESSSEKLAQRAITPKSANHCDSRSSLSANAHKRSPNRSNGQNLQQPGDGHSVSMSQVYEETSQGFSNE